MPRRQVAAHVAGAGRGAPAAPCPGRALRGPGPHHPATAAVRQALADQGVGILIEIDVQATLKTEPGHDMEDYLILGARDSPLAVASGTVWGDVPRRADRGEAERVRTEESWSRVKSLLRQHPRLITPMCQGPLRSRYSWPPRNADRGVHADLDPGHTWTSGLQPGRIRVASAGQRPPHACTTSRRRTFITATPRKQLGSSRAPS